MAAWNGIRYCRSSSKLLSLNSIVNPFCYDSFAKMFSYTLVTRLLSCGLVCQSVFQFETNYVGKKLGTSISIRGDVEPMEQHWKQSTENFIRSISIWRTETNHQPHTVSECNKNTNYPQQKEQKKKTLQHSYLLLDISKLPSQKLSIFNRYRVMYFNTQWRFQMFRGTVRILHVQRFCFF